ncbi:hypothetical protein AVEN_227432-1 [Araneus ventricosus]|uniref:Uncharacterized protein n=1 Tax=Araneus ventricosus TaxID=182803 RepID=A0A4Y2SCJ4_ARAVE|nr:hypothetical protein AVEN_176037-1 [Araneus ventricosus]GBN85646.1 hypothetical protein AVEN_97357-1 [Araneus ventricosus]GBN85651.1 hypothetical protein AVEN_227432-1 [Araneus ventricosus]
MSTSLDSNRTQAVHPTPTQISLLQQDLRLMNPDPLDVQYQGIPASSRVLKITSNFEATRGLFWMDIVTFNLGETTPEMEHPLQISTTMRGRFTPTHDLTCNRLNTKRILSGIGFEPGTFRFRDRHLTTRLPRLLVWKVFEKVFPFPVHLMLFEKMFYSLVSTPFM